MVEPTAGPPPPLVPPPPAPARTAPATGEDWTVQAADTIESLVTVVRQNTVGRATKIARTIVYGIVGAFLAAIAMIMAVIMFSRLLAVYLPFETPGRNVWVSYVLTGGILTVAGLLIIRKANRSARRSER